MTRSVTVVLVSAGLAITAGPVGRRSPEPAAARARALVQRMTLAEKVSQLRYDAPAIPRLGIPAYNWWSEANHGVARAGPATVFPQVIGLAATFDDSLVYDAASAISDEARAKYAAFSRIGRRDLDEGLTFFAPNINIVRDPRWGRGQETYGEDPLLTATLAVQFVRGMQGNDPYYLKTLTTAKHFAVHSGPEPLRHTADEYPSAQDLWSTYLPAFAATVRDAHVGSVMCAYSAFRGRPDCASPALLDSILRRRLGFTGYVVSDCWAIDDVFRTHKAAKSEVRAAAMALAAGTDLNCGVAYRTLENAVKHGLVPKAAVDTAAVRLFTARFRLGMFDDSARVPWDTIPYAVVGDRAHHALALRAARESIVLLKNDGVLPFGPSVRTIAVIGPDAHNHDVMVGNYHGTPRTVSYPDDAIRRRFGPDGRVLVAEGSEVADGIPVLHPIPASALETPDGRHGLRAEYFANAELQGAPARTESDTTVAFTWLDHPPLGGGIVDSFSVRWSGRIVAPVTGTYRVGFVGMSAVKFYFRDSLMFAFQTQYGPEQRTFDVPLTAGRGYDVRLEFRNWGPNPDAHLVWAPPRSDRVQDAIADARRADAVVLVLGLSPRLEGEESGLHIPGFDGGDRTTLALPAPQEMLLRAVGALGKPTVVVLTTGSAVTVPWAVAHANAILEAWYPGEAGGEAIADVLFGDYDPAGRLPVTFYRSVRDLPPFTDYAMDGHTYRYFTGTPLYPFGFGLSYTTFRYSRLKLSPTATATSGVRLVVDVRNTGSRAGDEVVQVYAAHPGAPYRVPLRALVAFRRLHLGAGERRTVAFALGADALTVVDTTGRRVIPPGPVVLSVGGEQPGMTGTSAAATTETLTDTVHIDR